jgi:nitroreductase
MDIFDTIVNRRSVRGYSPNPIPAAVMGKLRQAMRFAPSACNYQPWHFILVADEQLRQQIAEASMGQMWMAEAPLIVVGCGHAGQAYKTMGGHANSVDIDVAIAMDHLMLAAAAEGLGTCWIGAFSEPTVKKLLSVPANTKIVGMTPLGYPSSPKLIHPLDEHDRKPQSEIFSIDRYGNTDAGSV